MSKYAFFNDILSDDMLVSTFTRCLKYDLMMSDSRPDILQVFITKLKLQYGYKIIYKFVDFKDPDIIQKYGLKHNTDVYAVKYQKKDIFIAFNKNLKMNINRFLCFKVMAYDFFDCFDDNQELRLSLKTNNTDDDILAERLAIELVIPRWDLEMIKRNCSDSQDTKKKFLEPELISIREKEYIDKVRTRTWTLADVMKFEH